MHIALSCIAMGLLQSLSIRFMRKVKSSQLRYQRTPSRERVSEGTLMHYFRKHFFRLMVQTPELRITRIIQEPTGIHWLLSDTNFLLLSVEESNVYNVHFPMMQIMFGCCLRVGEVIGLTWSDVDMKAREIRITNQLVYHDLGDGYQFHDTTPKTDAGVRRIPMTQVVYKAFLKQKELNFTLGRNSDIEIGGRSGFIFNTKHGRPIMPAGVNSYLKNIVNAYNKKETKLAEKEEREPELMPHISAHILRHSGCTRLGENHVDPKVMQYLMGHSDMKVTMNVYNHITEMGRVEKEIAKMDATAVV